jgi:hypothetical protein
MPAGKGYAWHSVHRVPPDCERFSPISLFFKSNLAEEGDAAMSRVGYLSDKD